MKKIYIWLCLVAYSLLDSSVGKRVLKCPASYSVV